MEVQRKSCKDGMASKRLKTNNATMNIFIQSMGGTPAANTGDYSESKSEKDGEMEIYHVEEPVAEEETVGDDEYIETFWENIPLEESIPDVDTNLDIDEGDVGGIDDDDDESIDDGSEDTTSSKKNTCSNGSPTNKYLICSKEDPV